MQKTNGVIRKLPVLWIILSTLLLILLVNMPLIYGYFGVHGSYIWKLWGYAPHQFIFLIVPLPLATFATLVGLTIIFSTLTNSPEAHGILKWCGKNWIVIILFGVILSTIFAVFDYYGNPKVFDRFEADYAEKAVDSADEIREKFKHIEDQTELNRINRQANERANSLIEDESLTKDKILNLDSAVFLRAAKDGEFQINNKLLNPVSHLLSELQLTFALFVGFAALFAAFLLFLSHFSPGVDLSKATPAVITALAFLALYPLCFGYWSAEINALTGKPINNVGYLIAGGLILVIGILLAVVDENVRNVASGLGTALPALLSLFALGATRIVGIENLRILIGVEANPATRFFILIALVIIGLILSSMLVIQYEESFRGDDA